MSFEISIDLVNEAKAHLAFLAEINKIPALHDEVVLRNALRRYEMCWLPLLQSNDGAQVEPPVDVHWIWHVHLLAPTYYNNDCSRLINKVPDHKLKLLHSERQAATEMARALWLSANPTEPFDIDLTDTSSLNPDFKSYISYDIVTAATRQKTFYYHVSLPHYCDDKFLRTAVERYQKFVSLKKVHRDAFLVPMYDVDLVWHTHQLHPLAYKQDTEKFLGHMFNHDDSTTDRTPDSFLSQSDNMTRQLWKEAYGEKFPIRGAMYRGEPPNGKLYNISAEQLYQVATNTINVAIQSLKIYNVEDKFKKVKVKGKVLGQNESMDAPGIKIFAEKRKQKPFELQNLPAFELDAASPRMLVLDITKKQPGLSGIFKKQTSHKMVAFKGEADKLNLHNCMASFSMQMAEGNDPHVQLDGSITRLRGPIVMNLSVGNFETATMPENVEQMWGPIPLKRLPPGVENSCLVASHRLVNNQGQTTFTCRVIHSLPLRMSAVQIYYRDQMSAVSHLIGPEQLPKPDQVQLQDAVTLDNRVGERAMVIKNNQGDWGIVKGKWSGFRKGVAGVKGSPGSMRIKFQHLREDHTYTCSPLFAGEPNYSIGHVRIDLKKGKVSVSDSTNEVSEYLCLAFAISVLHVLCEPRPEIRPDGTTVTKVAKRGRHAIQDTNSDQMSFMMACGYMYCMTIPSNTWLYWDTHRHYWDSDYHDHDHDHDGTDTGDNDLDAGDTGAIDGGEDGTFCPWDPDGVAGVEASVGADTSGCGGCGGCGASCGTSGGGAGCGGGDGGGGGGCGSSCGASCGGGGGCGGGCGGGGCGG